MEEFVIYISGILKTKFFQRRIYGLRGRYRQKRVEKGGVIGFFALPEANKIKGCEFSKWHFIL